MSPNQEENLQFIMTNFELLVDSKYRAGDKEHGGGDLLSLNVLDLLDNAIEEAIDQIVFLLTLKRKIF